jgi:hypothetical protein
MLKAERAPGGIMDQESIIDAVKKAAANNRLSCEKARELAEELKVPVSEIGKICNVLKIKITACQLGCF